jgi:hypothetical protein
MGLIINPRGTSGAGKSWLVREAMAAYRRRGAGAVPLCRAGRSRPIGWRLDRPWGGRPLAVIGHYEATRGGTDTIPLTDGGLDEVFRLTNALAGDGHDVLFEGLQLSGEVERTAALARAQRMRDGRLCVLCLDTPLSRCVQNVVTRRRVGQAARPGLERTARAGRVALVAACESLRHSDAEVEVLETAAALRRTLALLGVNTAQGEGGDLARRAPTRTAMLPSLAWTRGEPNRGSGGAGQAAPETGRR